MARPVEFLDVAQRRRRRRGAAVACAAVLGLGLAASRGSGGAAAALRLDAEAAPAVAASGSGSSDDDAVDSLCVRYCPNTTSAADAACRLCELEKVVRFHNAYEDASGVPIGEGFYPYDYLVEMWKPTTAELNAYELGDEAVSRVRRVDWAGDDVGGGGRAEGSRITMTFTTGGARNVTVSMRVATTAMKDYGFTATLAVTVKYVRHEIRSLSEDDRGAFLDALSVCYGTQDDEGKRTYGDKYRSSHYMIRKHLEGAASKDCDHWHDDAGIVNHHVAFTLEMEQALQAVNPAVTIPYWDYSFDSYYYNASAKSCGDACLGSDWTASDVWTDDWFGPIANASSGYAVAGSGRFAWLPVMSRASGARAFSTITNSYGALRSPWNENPVPFLSRSRSIFGVSDTTALPDCSAFYWAFNGSTTIGRLFQEFNGQLHGPVHVLTGGSWGFDERAETVLHAWMAHATNAPKVSLQSLLASKWLWRQGYLRCPDACAADATESCSCSCPEALRSGWSAAEFWNRTGLDALTGSDFAGWPRDTLVDALCHVGHVGDSWTSAAPLDPVFWILHGLAERFVGFKRILAHLGYTTLDQAWTYDHQDGVYSDTHVVCDWSGVESEAGLPDCETGTCAGHREDDLLPFGGFLGNDETYTNREFWDFISPYNEDIPYTYDSFTNWPACAAMGLEWSDFTDFGPTASPTKAPTHMPSAPRADDDGGVAVAPSP